MTHEEQKNKGRESFNAIAPVRSTASSASEETESLPICPCDNPHCDGFHADDERLWRIVRATLLDYRDIENPDRGDLVIAEEAILSAARNDRLSRKRQEIGCVEGVTERSESRGSLPSAALKTLPLVPETVEQAKGWLNHAIVEVAVNYTTERKAEYFAQVDSAIDALIAAVRASQPPRPLLEDKEDSAGLIHQTIPDAAETEPRPIRHLCKGCGCEVGSPGLCGECGCEEDGSIW